MDYLLDQKPLIDRAIIVAAAVFFVAPLIALLFSNIVFVIIVPLLYANESRNQWPKSSIYYVVHTI